MKLSLEQMKSLSEEDQKKLFKRLSTIRSISKNANYACQYLAGVSRLALTAGVDEDTARKLHTAYWEKNWSWKEVAKQQKVKEIDGDLWLFNPISKFWYSLRSRHDIGSTLVQGSASYCFDRWVMNIRRKRKQLTAQFHDEVVLCIKEGFEEKAKELLNWAIEETNKQLKLNRVLSIGTQFGYSYDQIH